MLVDRFAPSPALLLDVTSLSSTAPSAKTVIPFPSVPVTRILLIVTEFSQLRMLKGM